VSAQQTEDGAQVDIAQHARAPAGGLSPAAGFNAASWQSSRHARILDDTYEKFLKKYLNHGIRKGRRVANRRPAGRRTPCRPAASDRYSDFSMEISFLPRQVDEEISLPDSSQRSQLQAPSEE
jgi:hypothetical protein